MAKYVWLILLSMIVLSSGVDRAEGYDYGMFDEDSTPAPTDQVSVPIGVHVVDPALMSGDQDRTSDLRPDPDVQDPVIVEPQSIELHECSDDKLKVSFLCNPDWELRTEEDALFIIISRNNPRITMTVAKSEAPVLFLTQLTRSALKEIGEYADGFTMQSVLINDVEAVNVVASSESFPQMYLQDYYLIHDVSLYALLFSVEPKDQSPAYEDMIYKIKESFRFE